MKTLIITPKDEKDFEFLSSLLGRLGYGAKVLYDDDKQDMALLKAMLEDRKEEYVPEEDILKALGKK